MDFMTSFYSQNGRINSINVFFCREIVAGEYVKVIKNSPFAFLAYDYVRVRTPSATEQDARRALRFLLRRFNLSEDKISISPPYTDEGKYGGAYGLTICSSVEKTTCGFSPIWWAIGVMSIDDVAEEAGDEEIIRGVAGTFEYRSDYNLTLSLLSDPTDVSLWEDLRAALSEFNFLHAIRHLRGDDEDDDDDDD